MATPATMKHLEDKKLAAQKRKEKKQESNTQLLSLSSQTNAPSTHLLVRTEPIEGVPPRHIDLQPLGGGGAYSTYRERKEDFSADVTERPYGLVHYTNFTDGSASVPVIPQQPYQPHPQQYVLQPLSRSMNYYGQRRQQQPGGRKSGPVKVKQQEVEPIPENMPTWQITVHPDKLVCFHGKNNFLSQLYPVKLVMDGNEYQSMEHYYQACKLFSLVGPQAAQELRSIKDPLMAKTRTRELLFRMGVTNDKVDLWKSTHGVLILQHAMRQKFSVQHKELHDELLATGDALLVQAYDRDSFYAAGLQEAGIRDWAKENDGKTLKFPSQMSHENVKYLPLVGKGKNVLGALAMHVRKQLNENIMLEPIPKASGKETSSAVADLPYNYEDGQREQQISPGLANAMSCLNELRRRIRRMEEKSHCLFSGDEEGNVSSEEEAVKREVADEKENSSGN